MKRIICFSVIFFLSLTASIALADDPRLVIESGGHMAQIKELIFTSDGRYLVSAGDDKVIRIWDVKTGETVRTIRGQIGTGLTGSILTMALSRNDKYLAAAGRLSQGDAVEPCCGTIRLHDLSNNGEVIGLLKGHTNYVFALAFSSDSRYLASGSRDRTIRIWDMDQRREVHLLKGHEDDIYAVAFSPDGKWVVSGSDDHTLRLWSVQEGRLVKELKGHEARVWSDIFSPDGRYVASGSKDKTIRLWDAKTGEFIKVLGRQENEVLSLSFDPKGQWILTGGGGPITCTVFAVPSGEVITQFRQHDNLVETTAVSADGKLVATGGGENHPIYIWDPQSGQIFKNLIGKGKRVRSVGFATDNRSISYGNMRQNVNDNNLGTLQHVIALSQDSVYEVLLGKEVRNESDYVRSRERFEEYEIKTKTGGDYGYRAILQIRRSGTILHEVKRDKTSGYRHISYSFTHDGRYIVSGGSRGVLTLYETQTGKKVQDFIGHTGDVSTVAVSPDNNMLVSGSSDQTVRLWDLESGKNLLTIFVGSDREWVAWTPEGYYTSSLNGDKYIGWHLNQGEDKAAKFYPAAQFQKQFYRPDVVAEYLKTRDITVALRQANEKRGLESPTQPLAVATDIRNILPPDVFVYSPDEDGMVLYRETVLVKARVKSDRPIADVKVFVNGIQIAGKEGGRAKGNPRERLVELEARLQEGRNLIKVIASHDKAESDPQTRTVMYQPDPGKKRDVDKPDLILLAVGIADYKDEAFKLDYADDDARIIVEAFRGQKGLIFNDVKTKLLPNEKEPADRANIVRALNWLRREGTQRDIRLVFLSGHGGLDNQNNYYFFSSDHDPKEDLEVYDVRWSVVLDALTAVPGKAILMVDTCHAAGASGGRKKKGSVNFDEVLKEIKSQYAGLVTFAASTGNEVSVEDALWKQGAFTKAVIEGLKGQADGYGGKRDGMVETKELGAWVIDQVKELTKGDQHAIHSQPPDLPHFPLVVLP